MSEKQNQDRGQNLFEQCLKLFITLELESRYRTKQINKPFPYTIVQVIFFPDGKPTIVKFDAEVSGKIHVRMKDQTDKGNDSIYLIQDVEASLDVEFDSKDYPDCAHATFFRHGEDFWHACYDLRLNKDLSAKHLVNARMFLHVAEETLRRKHWPPFVDNLYSASELAAKAILLAIADSKFRRTTTHGTIKTRYNYFVIHGVVPVKHQAAFNKLYGLRDNARYMRGPLNLTEQEAVQLLEDVKEIIEKAERQL